MDAIKLAISHVEGGQAALAKHLGLAPQQVNQWVRGIRPVPARHALAIEALVAGKVTRQELCPEVFGGPTPKPEAA